jgi:hypothetical protein
VQVIFRASTDGIIEEVKSYASRLANQKLKNWKVEELKL